MSCAECDCVVEAGVRVVTCKDETACCCTTVPVGEAAGEAPRH